MVLSKGTPGELVFRVSGLQGNSKTNNFRLTGQWLPPQSGLRGAQVPVGLWCPTVSNILLHTSTPRVCQFGGETWLGGVVAQAEPPWQSLTFLLALFQGSAPILVAMVILLNIGVAILFINFFI